MAFNLVRGFYSIAIRGFYATTPSLRKPSMSSDPIPSVSRSISSVC
jgi:hypothetical protein